MQLKQTARTEPSSFIHSFLHPSKSSRTDDAYVNGKSTCYIHRKLSRSLARSLPPWYLSTTNTSPPAPSLCKRFPNASITSKHTSKQASKQARKNPSSFFPCSKLNRVFGTRARLLLLLLRLWWCLPTLIMMVIVGRWKRSTPEPIRLLASPLQS